MSKTRTCERDALGMLRECDSPMAIKDFGMPLNLMLGCSAVLVNSEEDGIAMLRHGLASSCKSIFDSWLQARVMDYNARKVSS